MELSLYALDKNTYTPLVPAMLNITRIISVTEKKCLGYNK